MDTSRWRVETFASLDSTNTWVAEQAKAGAAEGLVARTDFQTAGRGRLDRVWQAPPDTSLLCSVLLRPAVAADALQLVVAAVALSLRNAIATLTMSRPDLKWPNDLLFGEKKVAGILAEVVATAAGPAVVVGFGVNCLSVDPAFTHATSISSATGVDVNPSTLLQEVLVELERLRPLLDRPAGLFALRSLYLEALVTVGQALLVTTPDGVVEGVGVGVDESGRLEVDVNGERRVFGIGDVVHVRPQEIL
jgi:BirA family biotin operon repressor/biotin-[acetyl-CoA-carboxylase] ligase